MILLDPLKFVGGPGFLIFIVLAIALGLVVARRSSRYRFAAWTWTTIVATSALVLALPVVAHAIVERLPRVDGGEAQCTGWFETLVVFDGDNRRGRLAETLRLWHGHAPRMIIVSGSEWLVEELVAAGVPRHVVRQDESASTTREQVRWLTEAAARARRCEVAVIASELQMPRVAALVRAHGIPVSLHAAPVDSEVASQQFWRYIPSYAALRVSRDALYEVAAIHYYRRQGWIPAGG